MNMYPHRLHHRIPRMYAPMPPIAQWHSRLGSSDWPFNPATGRSRCQTDEQRRCFAGGGELRIVVWWMFCPFGRSTHRVIWGFPTLVHTTFIAGNDEQQISLVEAAMGISLLELARRRLHPRYH
jgi:hypothetical protein